mmetsp:Transcript_32597/g.68873  ORF Transcript_32597/g.68873 Transcript_32597/m.68873 type:complete len:203 (-) Transcript_32597:810-1418(-)
MGQYHLRILQIDFVIEHSLTRSQLISRFDERLRAEFETDKAHDGKLSEEEESKEDILEGLPLLFALEGLHVEIDRVLTHVRGATSALAGASVSTAHLLRQESFCLPSEISAHVHSHVILVVGRTMASMGVGTHSRSSRKVRVGHHYGVPPEPRRQLRRRPLDHRVAHGTTVATWPRSARAGTPRSTTAAARASNHRGKFVYG